MTEAIKTRLILGSGAGCDFVIADPSISAQHLAITPGSTPSMVQLEDLSSTHGTWVAGKRIQTAEISILEVIQLGQRPVSIRHLAQEFHPSLGEARGSLVVGRAQVADIVLPLPMISGRHLQLRTSDGAVEVRDLGSSNGTTVDGQVVTEWTPFSATSVLQLGSFRVPPLMVQDWLTQLSLIRDVVAQTVRLPSNGSVLLGRDPDCDVPLDFPQVSWHHARIEASGGVWTLTDLQSANGTLINEQPVERARLRLTDQVALGDVPLQLESRSKPASFAVDTVRLDAVGVTRKLTQGALAGRVILDDIGVSIYPGELVALMGPSGAGKTTLLEILTGQRRPEGGHVLFNGHNLHDAPQLRSHIGYVPQEDIMHRDLTVFEVLHHAAQLRLPPTISRKKVVAHVEKLITRMGLAHIRDSIIGGESVRGVSGGQRKRVNIALELITEPPLLFLDEPTSGLDATSTMEVLMVLRQLADTGKTIIMTIHQPRIEAFQKVDQLLLLTKGGRLAYFGPAGDAGAYFSQRSALPLMPQSNPADYVIDALDPADPGFQRAPEAWQADYRASPIFQSHVTGRQDPMSEASLPPLPPSPARRGAVRQLLTLLRRYTIRKRRDRSSLLIQLLQPVIIGGLLVLLYHSTAEILPVEPEALEDWFCLMNPEGTLLDASGDEVPCSPQPPPGLPEGTLWETPDPPQTHPAATRGFHACLFLLGAASFWLGCSNVAREVVSDRPVFLRERRSDLHQSSYLGAIFILQMLLAGAQILIMGGLVYGGLSLHLPSPLMAGCVLLATASVGVSLGLAVSAWSKTEVTAISVIPILLLPQLMLAGYLRLYADMEASLQMFCALIPIRWSFQGLATLEYAAWHENLSEQTSGLSVGLEEVIGFPDADVAISLGWLGLMTLVFLFLSLRLVARSR